MGLSKTGNEAAILERRERVASLLVRGATERSIQAELLKDPKVACSIGTVHSDIKAIEAEWRRRCARVIDKHRADLLACYWDIYAEARAKDALGTAMDALASIGVLLGANAPPLAPVDEKGRAVTIAVLGNVTMSELVNGS